MEKKGCDFSSAGLSLRFRPRSISSRNYKIEEAKKQGLWDTAYTNKIKDRIPSDLKQALLEDGRAWGNFLSFANSYRNMYCGWVKAAKTKETRQKRIIEVVKRSRQKKKPGVE